MKRTKIDLPDILDKWIFKDNSEIIKGLIKKATEESIEAASLIFIRSTHKMPKYEAVYIDSGYDLSSSAQSTGETIDLINYSKVEDVIEELTGHQYATFESGHGLSTESFSMSIGYDINEIFIENLKSLIIETIAGNQFCEVPDQVLRANRDQLSDHINDLILDNSIDLDFQLFFSELDPKELLHKFGAAVDLQIKNEREAAEQARIKKENMKDAVREKAKSSISNVLASLKMASSLEEKDGNKDPYESNNKITAKRLAVFNNKLKPSLLRLFSKDEIDAAITVLINDRHITVSNSVRDKYSWGITARQETSLGL